MTDARSLASRVAARGLCAAVADRRRCAALALGVLGAGALLVSSLFPPRPRLVWNTSESAPVGLYRVDDARVLASGDMVLARVPWRFRRLAAERRYIPSNVPLVKRVVAVPGDRVCGVRGAIFINGKFIAARAARDARGRPMPWWNGCVVLGGGAYFLLMESPASFDGRYFGPTRRADIIGEATPLWMR
ncbi:S26 family signal peptidase [Sphingosinicella sp.]|uniref:S26 family signal peptidase n=1 Tax=Sphingosinicella sp. TaxID=1917971 RepID=UPI00180373F3|nr:S26 family signal peptidase [Sphingosinicella sp.]MBA4756667.1 S26 family signal peptidase [Sphingosinicella sp.]